VGESQDNGGGIEMHDTSRCREKTEGKISRRRTYKCRKCGEKFQEDRLKPLPEAHRICPACQEAMR